MPKVKRAKVRITKKAKKTARALIKGADGMPLDEVGTYGTEPMPIDSNGTPPNMHAALNWYSRFKSHKDADKYLIEFAKQYGFTKDEISDMRACPSHFIPSSYCWLAKMKMNGIKLEESQENRIIVKIRERINHGKYLKDLNNDAEAEKDQVVKKNIHQVMREAMNAKASTIMGEIDGWLDDFCDNNMTGEVDFYGFLSKMEAKPAHVSIVEDRLGIWLAEFISARDGLEPDFVEGYSHLSTKQINKLIKWTEELKSQAANYTDVFKSSRGPRKGGGRRVKAIDPVKMTSKLEVIAIDGVQSLDKTKIIGANELWVVNDWGAVRHFRSETTTGFQISGRKLKNITEATQYRIPRRSKDDKEKFTALIKKFPKKVRDRKAILDPLKVADKIEDVSPSIQHTLIWQVA